MDEYSILKIKDQCLILSGCEPGKGDVLERLGNIFFVSSGGADGFSGNHVCEEKT